MWSTKPSLSWTAQCLAGVFLQICFPSGLGEGEGVEHLREWGGSCRLLKGSPPAHVAAGSAVCVRAFVMNPHPPPPTPLSAPLTTLSNGTFHLGCCPLAGLLPR